MSDILTKFKRNLKNGTLIKNGTKALKNRFTKYVKYNNIFYSFDKHRVQTKKYQADIPSSDSNHFKAGNYYLDSRVPLNEDSIVYSLGILTDVSFDSFVSEKYGCQIHMYDPTPTSIAYMKKEHADNPLFKFNPLGVWTENTQLKFFKPKHGGSASAINSEDSDEDDFFLADCKTMQELMEQNGHGHIDVFKADIEGAALPIVEQMVEQAIFPSQIVVEFERPMHNQEEIDNYFKSLSKLRSTLKKKGYNEYLLPRQIAKYYSLELLFVKLPNTNP